MNLRRILLVSIVVLLGGCGELPRRGPALEFVRGLGYSEIQVGGIHYFPTGPIAGVTCPSTPQLSPWSLWATGRRNEVQHHGLVCFDRFLGPYAFVVVYQQ